MKRLAFIFGILALAVSQITAQTSTWVSDPAHSEISFSITHLTITNVHGRFGKVAATINYNEADVSKSTVTATIDVGTVDTGETKRDSEVKSDKFFDLVKFPTATFTSTSVTKTNFGLSVAGNLTLHGVTKPVVLMVEGPAGPVQSMDHKTHEGFSAITTISRSAFGIGTGFGPAMVGDDVKLTIDLDVIKQ